MKVHPEFFTDTMKWEAGDHEASSLKELRKLLPPGTEIVGYRPRNGYKANWGPTTRYSNNSPNTVDIKKYRVYKKSVEPTPFVVEKPKVVACEIKKNVRESRPWNDDAVRLKELGFTSNEISKKLGVTRSAIGGYLWRVKEKQKREKLEFSNGI